MRKREEQRAREPLQELPMACTNTSQRPVSPGPGLLKRRVSDAASKPQRNMLSAPAQRLATRQVHMVVQREKPPAFATRVKDGVFIGTVHAALDPGFIFVRVDTIDTNHVPGARGRACVYFLLDGAPAPLSPTHFGRLSCD